MDEASLSKRLKWFSSGLSILLIIVCNAMLVAGWWISGVNLDRALSKPEIYDQNNAYCVQVSWIRVSGVEGPVKVCSKWLDVSDLSGDTHSIQPGVPLAMGTDGQLYYEGQRDEDYRLIGLVVFVIAVIGLGMWVKSYLITKYQLRLQTLDEQSS